MKSIYISFGLQVFWIYCLLNKFLEQPINLLVYPIFILFSGILIAASSLKFLIRLLIVLVFLFLNDYLFKKQINFSTMDDEGKGVFYFFYIFIGILPICVIFIIDLIKDLIRYCENKAKKEA